MESFAHDEQWIRMIDIFGVPTPEGRFFFSFLVQYWVLKVVSNLNENFESRTPGDIMEQAAG